MTTRRAQALAPWLLELGPIFWLIVFILLKSQMIVRFIRRSWDWVGDSDIIQQPDWGHIAFTLAILLVLTSITLPISRRARFVVLAVLLLALNCLLFADALYATHFNAIPSIKHKVTFGALVMIRSSIEQLMRPVHLLFFVDSLVFILITPIYFRICRRLPALSARQRGAALAAAGLAVLVGVFPAFREAEQAQLLDKPRRLIELGAVMGVLPYHLMDVALDRGDRIETGAAERRQVRDYFSANPPVEETTGDLRAVAKGANLIMIALESVMAFAIGREFEGQEITPRINAFARESEFRQLSRPVLARQLDRFRVCDNAIVASPAVPKCHQFIQFRNLSRTAANPCRERLHHAGGGGT